MFLFLFLIDLQKWLQWKLLATLSRPCTPFRELPSPQNIPETPGWTPGLDGASPFTPLATDVVRTYNEAMESIANLTSHEI